jgi:hypothetical protein
LDFIGESANMRREHHNQRKQLVKELIKEHNLEIKKDMEWNKLNDTTREYESVDLIIAFG